MRAVKKSKGHICFAVEKAGVPDAAGPMEYYQRNGRVYRAFVKDEVLKNGYRRGWCVGNVEYFVKARAMILRDCVVDYDVSRV